MRKAFGAMQTPIVRRLTFILISALSMQASSTTIALAQSTLPPGKQVIEQRYQQAQDVGKQNPAPKDAIGSRPAPGPPLALAAGIINDSEGPFSPEDVIVVNRWQGVVDGLFTVVYAGALANEVDQGIVIVASFSDTGSGIVTRFLAPILGGSLKITAATGSLLSLISSNGKSLGFDVLNQAFVTDTTPPVTSLILSGPNGNNGWYKGAAIATLTATDPDSRVGATYFTLDGGATQTYTAPIAISADGVHKLSFYSVDQAGNHEIPNVATISIDATPPVPSATASPAPNKNGWNNTPVTVSFTGIDTISGIASCSQAITLRSEGANQSASGTCTDNAGNVSAPFTISGINIDMTPPVASATALPATNKNAWNNGNVTVSYSGKDNLSGIDSCSAPVTLTNEAAAQTVTGTCTDKAGNTSAPVRTTVSIDKTPPIAMASIMPSPNANGWINTNAIVLYSGTDNLSGIDSCSSSITFTTEGAGQTASGTCTDKAGNVSAPATGIVNIDKTPPVISGMAAAGCSVWPPNGKMVTVATVTAADAVSGVALGSLQVTGTSNEPNTNPQNPEIVITPNGSGGFVIQLQADRLGKGNGRIYTLTATANDLAGNTATVTASCTVPHDQGK